MKNPLKTYTTLRAAGLIVEEIISREFLTLKLKNGKAVRLPISLEIRKAVVK